MRRTVVLWLCIVLSGCLGAPQAADRDASGPAATEATAAGGPTPSPGHSDAACDPQGGQWSGNAPLLPAFQAALADVARSLAEAVGHRLDGEGQVLDDGRHTWSTLEGGRVWAQAEDGSAWFQLRSDTWLEPEDAMDSLLSAVGAPGREAWGDYPGPAGVAIRLEHAGGLLDRTWHVHAEGFQVTALPDLRDAGPSVDRAGAEARAEAYLDCIGQDRFDAQPVEGADWAVVHGSLVHRVRVGPEEEVHPCCASSWVYVDAVTGAIHRVD